MRAYIQSCLLSDGLGENAQDADYGFRLRGYEIIPYTAEELRSGVYDQVLQNEKDSVIFYGGVGTVKEAVFRSGRPAPPNMDLPQSLTAFFGRAIQEGTMRDIRVLVNAGSPRLPLHAKPRDHGKLFTGRVFREFKDLIPSAHVSSDEPIIIQECVEFVSEWRAIVLRGGIINVSFYKGDPLLFPDRHVMQRGLEAFVERPIACAMDWGVTSDNKTLLVEVNDAHSLGNYGLRCGEYAQVIEARWREMMGLPDYG